MFSKNLFKKYFIKVPPKTHHKGLIYYSFMTTLPKWDYKKDYENFHNFFSQMFSKNLYKKYFTKVPPKTHHKGLIYYSFMTTPIKWNIKKNMENFHNFFHKCSRKTFSKSISQKSPKKPSQRVDILSLYDNPTKMGFQNGI
jgi:hypothetical protein